MIVTLFAEASKFVTVFPYTSWAVKVFVPVKAMPSVCGLVSERVKWSRTPAETVVLAVTVSDPAVAVSV